MQNLLDQVFFQFDPDLHISTYSYGTQWRMYNVRTGGFLRRASNLTSGPDERPLSAAGLRDLDELEVEVLND